MNIKNLLAVILILLIDSALPLGADNGSISGTISLDRARVTTDGPKSDKDVVVFLEPIDGKTYPAPTAHVEMDQKGLVFLPHVMAVQKGTPVDFLNSDNDRHNVYFLFEKTGETLDIGTWGLGQTVTHAFDDTGVVITLCQLHLEMAAYILVFDHPFYAVTEFDSQSQTASFQISNVPPGEYRLNAWHKKLKLQGGGINVSIGDSDAKQDLVITRKKYAK